MNDATMVNRKHYQPNLRALILLWAFAESGIGGVLHALKLPFTGLMVGGIAILCISLTAYWAVNQKKAIMEALFAVLLVKLAVSPHSPWQAYIAVLFQGYIGYLLFRGRKGFAWRAMVFSVVCMAESALQKMLMAWLIYGTGFFKALDQAASSVLKSFGLVAHGSVVFLFFSAYLLLYLVGGVILGRWIPRLPVQIDEFSQVFPVLDHTTSQSSTHTSKRRKSVLLGFVFLFLFLMGLKWLAPQIPLTHLFYIFIRSVLISSILIVIVGPLIVNYIRKWANKKEGHQALVTATLDQIPLFADAARTALQWVSSEYKGMKKVKFFILALLVITLRMSTPESDA